MTTRTRSKKSTPEQRAQHAANFLKIFFEPEDCVTLRPMRVESAPGEKKRMKVLYPHVSSVPLRDLLQDRKLGRCLQMLDAEKAEVFFGICPRTESLGDATYELQWQIPRVRCLWADVDNLQGKTIAERVVEVEGRLEKAELPQPTLIVSSGRGIHLYWKLNEAIETHCDPCGVEKEWVRDDNGNDRPISVIVGEDGSRVDLDDRTTFKRITKHALGLTPQAERIKTVLKQIAIAIDGDHTTDLSRILRLPGTYNRKDGKQRICKISQENPGCTYALSDFDHLREAETQNSKSRTKVSGNRKKRSITPRPDRIRNSDPKASGAASQQIYADGRLQVDIDDEARLEARLEACREVCDDDDRSVIDFALCAFAAEKGFAPEYIYGLCQNLSKFAEKGERYFQTTWDNALKKIPMDAPCIRVGFNEERVNSDVLEALSEHRELYDFNGQLVEIIARGNASPVHSINGDRLREIISGTMSFETSEKLPDGKRKRVGVPGHTARAILSHGGWPEFPTLKGIRFTPLITSDGAIVQHSGFHEKSGYYLSLDQTFPRIPEAPSSEQIQGALGNLSNLVGDFPFANPAHKSAWLAALLTGFATELYSGNTAPLFLIDATQPGCGKTLLADVISLILTGNSAPRQAVTSSDEEFRKLVTARAMDGAPLTLLDNVAGTLGSPSLDAALTGTEWTDRILGQSKTVSMRLSTIWMATGNNLQLAGDLHRRVCHIRLESQTERPDQRSEFRNPNLLDHVRSQRGQLVADCLTLLRGFYVAGKPDQELPTWGSFEGWSLIIRNLLVWQGLPDPAETRTAIQEDDESTLALASFLEILQRCDPDHLGKTQNEIFEIAEGRSRACEDHAAGLKEAIECLTGKSLMDLKSSLGKHLSKYKGRIADGRRLSNSNAGGRRSWSVETVQARRGACSR